MALVAIVTTHGLLSSWANTVVDINIAAAMVKHLLKIFIFTLLVWVKVVDIVEVSKHFRG